MMFAGLFEQREQALDFFNRAFVGVGRAGAFVNRGIDQHGDGLCDAIEHEQLIRNDEIHRGRFEFIMRRARHGRLYVVNEFVTDETHRPARETRQPRQSDRAILLHHALDDFEAVLHAILARLFARRGNAELLHDLAVLNDFNLAARLLDDRARIAADKRVASEMFAAFHGFKEERLALATDFAISRERRFDVGENAGGDRDQVALIRQFQKFFKRR